MGTWEEGKRIMEEQKKLIENAYQAKRNSEEERRKLLVKFKQEKRPFDQEKIKLQEKADQEKTLVKEEQMKLKEKAEHLEERERILREKEESNSRLKKELMLEKKKLDEEKKLIKTVLSANKHKENITQGEGNNDRSELGAKCRDTSTSLERKNHSRNISSKEIVQEKIHQNDSIAFPVKEHNTKLKDASENSTIKDIDAGEIFRE